MSGRKILIVDDDVALRHSLAEQLRLHEEFQPSEAEDGAKAVVEMGDLGYWPPGHAFCIFFGPTPASRGDECRAASVVNVVGKLEGDPTIFKKVRAGTRVTIERQ